MWTIAIKNLRANLSRFVATLIAIATGVGFLTAGTMVTNSVENSLGGEIDRQYAAVTAVVEMENADLGQDVPLGGIALDERDRVAEVSGVAEAVGEIAGTVKIVGADVDSSFDSGVSVHIWHPDSELNALDLEDGREPTRAGEVTLDRGLAEDNKVAAGDRIELGTPEGAVEATVVGITRFGSTDSADRNGTVTAIESFAFELITNEEPTYSRILVRGDDGVSATALTDRIDAVVGDGLSVITGEQFRTDAKGDLSSFFTFLRPVLQGFSGLALFVCGFVIFNTFSVVVGQRVRELALMRAVAATPRQIRRSLRVEGLGVGLFGSVLGLGLGALLTFVLSQVLVALDLDLPAAEIAMTPGIVITGLLVGTLITFVSVLIPAYRAGRTAPVEAMREAAIEPSRVGRVRLGFAVGLLLAGTGLTWTKNAWLLGPGALFFVIGVFLAGPALVFWFARATRALFAAIGVAGRLSSDNLARNPKRTATTMNALVIGLLLVTLVTVAGDTLKAAAVSEINKYSTSDFLLGSATGEIDGSLLDDIAAVDGVSAMARLRQYRVEVDGHPDALTAVDPDDMKAVGIKVTAGSLDDLGDGVAVSDFGEGVALGDTKVYTDALGNEIPLEVTAILEFSIDAFSVGSIVTNETLSEFAPDAGVTGALLKVDADAKEEAGRSLERLTQPFGNVFLMEGNFIGQFISSLFDFLINAINGLLGMSIVIALIGIVNTLTLSIFERRRELGLLRAVGMTVQSVRRMIRLESVQTALLGTLVGMLAGLGLGWLLIRASELGDLTLKFGRLGILFGIGLVIGVIAAIPPTRRVTKLNVLEAISVS